ncbi:FAD-dependent monooxygenase [Nocardiopsis ganjiahuensis]|uniref:FAD-dependent monooxygenase n=1 Tax=Nocardiopsis ganjiahuensis TaxID=239984 RepID=UPI000349F268|nr:FAD-dependent monooxygenase [Nocardiopsis ganjiahuensis]
MSERTATVVGGGIAGLASALSLARAGWRTRVLESRSGTTEVGSGLALPRNGVVALNALGFDDAEIDRTGHRTQMTGFVDTLGRPILTMPVDDPQVREFTTVWGFHRQRLHGLLARAAHQEGVELVRGARVTGVAAGRPEGAPAVVSWQQRGTGPDTTGHETESDLVVGADGLRSAVRGALHPRVRPLYSGSTDWRAIVPVAALQGTGLDGRLVEYWGPGTEFGVMQVNAEQVYWYGHIKAPERAVFDDELATARAGFAGWAPEVLALIDATTPDQIMRHDVHHMPEGPQSYVRGRVVLIGDAAQGALPTGGLGAASALEDGASLGRLVGPARRGDLERALAGFDALRRPRRRALARQARVVARWGADLGGGWRQKLRNSAFRLVPAGAVVKSRKDVVHWAPPAPLIPA